MADEKQTLNPKAKTKKAAAKKAATRNAVTKKATLAKAAAAKKVTTRKAPAAPPRTATRPAPATAARPTAPRPKPMPEPQSALPPGKRPGTGKPVAVSAEQRTAMIQEAAYYKAEKRNFAPGLETEDWDEAEREVDERLAKG